jgi:hypothetical protein
MEKDDGDVADAVGRTATARPGLRAEARRGGKSPT